MRVDGLIARVEALRIEKGWSQQQLSERAGLGKGAVNDMVNHPERVPRVRTVDGIARALGVSADFLWHDAGAGGGAAAVEVGYREVLAAMFDGREAAEGAEADFASGKLQAFRHKSPTCPMLDTFSGVVLVDTHRRAVSGDLVFLERGNGAASICYLAEPYAIGREADGAIFHAVPGADGARLLGVVLTYVAQSRGAQDTPHNRRGLEADEIR